MLVFVAIIEDVAHSWIVIQQISLSAVLKVLVDFVTQPRCVCCLSHYR